MKAQRPSNRLLAFDFGQSRTGVAVTDEAGSMALPVGIILSKDKNRFWKEIESLLTRYLPIKILIGLPLHLDGNESSQTTLTKAFADELQKRWPDLSIEMVDERLSSRHAETLLKEIGSNRKKRSEKSDETSAWILLSSYLEQKAFQINRSVTR